MQLQKVLIPLGSVALIVVAYRAYAWPGVAMVLGALVMWLLLHFTRMLQVLRRAANRPVGYVDSAVMLHARLQPGMGLLQVVAMTRALGELLTPQGTQPEQFRWTDGAGSHVTCAFRGGRLDRWELFRPVPDEDAGEAGGLAP